MTTSDPGAILKIPTTSQPERVVKNPNKTSSVRTENVMVYLG